MEFISESLIDRVAAEVSIQDSHFIEKMAKEQPTLLAFLLADHVKILTRPEQELLLFLAVVIWQSILAAHPELPTLDETTLGQSEETNWQLLEANLQGTFRDRLTPFFDNHPQEDLLAFIEDAILLDDSSPVTNEGRTGLFVLLKTIVDAFVAVL